jgi:hypothetical protein
VQGGAGADESAWIAMLGANGQQSILVSDGSLSMNAGSGADSFAEILSDGVDNGMLAQSIVVNGDLLVSADQVGDATTGGYAAIVQTSGGAASQYIEVAGSVDVLGGVGANEGVTILSNGGTAQTILLSATGDLSIIGGDGEFAEAVVVGEGLTQDIIVTDGDILIQGNQDATNDGGAAYIVAFNNDVVQTIRAVAGGITVQGGTGNFDLAGIAMVGGNGQQIVEAGDGNIAVLAGSGDFAIAEIISFGTDGATAAQEVVASGDILVTADAAYASINSADSQLMFAGGDMVVTGGNALGASADITADNGQNITVLGGLQVLGGSSVDDGDHAIIEAGGTQLITVQSGGILIDGNAGDFDFGGTTVGAAIIAHTAGTQTIIVDGGGLTINGGTAAGAAAGIAQDAVEAQLLDITGPVSINGGSAAGTFGIVFGAGDQTVLIDGAATVTGGSANDDDYAGILSEGEQTLTVTGNLTLDANGGSETAPEGTESAGAFAIAFGDQTVNVGGNLNLLGGDNASALLESQGALQTVAVAGDINLDDGTGGNARVISAGDMVITSTGDTNISGNSGNFAGFSAAGDITLTNGGGVWAGVFDITSPGVLTITNSGAIVIDETTGEGVVTAPVLVLLGNGTIGSGATGAGGANTRLNTDVNEIVFGAAGKSVYISENDDVALRGTIGTVDLITDNAGDITDSTAALTAAVATLQTADGNIDFAGQINAVTTFEGVIANGGAFTYTGGPTTFANRTTSAEIGAGAGVYADTGIDINTGVGTTTITADLVEVAGAGDLVIAAGSIVLNAANATVGGDAPSASDGMITTANGTQTYSGPVVLLTNTQISAAGAAAVDFLSTIDGPGGLRIGSTPTFGGHIGSIEPLAYLVLDSADSYFIAPDADSESGPFTAVIYGSFVNNGTMHLDGPAGEYTFVVDAGSVGAGTGNFFGGEMDLGGNEINIFAATQVQVTGSDLPEIQLFNAWNGLPFTTFVGFQSGALYFKAPPPQQEIKDTHDRRRDRRGWVEVSYDGNQRTDAEYGGRAMNTRLVRPINASSFSTLLPYPVGHFTFGQEHQAPAAGLEPKQLVERNQQD